MNRQANLIRAVVLGFCAAGFALFPKWTVDDAFISYRYAENLARHGELNWIPGGDPVEGYTGIALPVVMAAWIRLGGDPVFGGRLFGLAGYALLLVAFHAWLGRLKVQEPLRAVAFAGLATNPILFTHSTSGLETSMFLAAITGALWAVERRAADARTGSEVMMWLILLIASLIRPEGAALAGIAGAVMIIFGRGANIRRSMLVMISCYVLPGALYFTWRWNYYGRLLPNTFYAKQFDGILNLITARRMLEFAHTFLSAPFIVTLAFWLLGMARRRGGPAADDQAPSRPSAWIAGFFALILSGEYLRSELVMNYSFRFFAPFLPVAWGLAAVWIQCSLARVGWMDHRKLSHAPAVLALVMISHHSFLYLGERVYVGNYRATLESEHVVIGRRLAEIMPPDESVACVMDAGAIPYYSKLRTFDFGKLNDEYLATGGKSAEETADYFFLMRPGAAVFTTRNWRRIDYLPESQAIAADPRFEDYDLVGRYRVPREKAASTYYQFLYLRRDLRERLALEKLDPNAVN